MPDETEDLRAPVYPTLWKPLMVKGVPRDWAVFSMIVAALAMMVAGWMGLRFYQLYGMAAGALLAAIGWLWAKFDPEFFSITLVRFQIGKTKGSRGGNEYHA
jgi:type IV secretory pathway VirB3-like protein